MSEATKNPTSAVETPATPEVLKAKKGIGSVEEWPTAEKAIEIGNSRDKGARHAFSVKDNGTVKHYTTTHEHFLLQKVCADRKIEIDHLNGKKRTGGGGGGGAKLNDFESIKAGVMAGSMPEADKLMVIANLEKMLEDAKAKAPVAPAAPKAPEKAKK